MKQFLAILLTIALTVCLLPAEAMATEALEAEDMAVGALTEGVAPEEKTMSGEPVVIGEDENRASVTWLYDDLGNIVLSEIYDYSTAETLQNRKVEVKYTYGTDADAGWNRLLTSI